MATKEIYLMRHGEILTQAKRFIGQTDLPLNNRGLKQAYWWRQKLSGVIFSRIFCSDLLRSRQTAQIIAAERLASVHIIPSLREIFLGEWDGIEVEKIRSCFPKEFRMRGESIADYRPPGGESFADLQKRVVPIWDKLIKNMEERILIVAHAGVNRVIICHILGVSLSELFRMGQDYGSLNIIEYTKYGLRVKAMNIIPDIH
ncbi:Phosphoglycerate mutase [Desulfofarcimen acetoxidans DSM 771]|uniref:Phosphoglycerate mutase n=1 Tax=Desulfofarcimen acetoxidans (strain ATCC 49208 / DSM 771 / KCTC 5769 / VKM B-1644 / 5575) TaxID=485916 RepID=C8W6P5_DESAS|nr:histidine phosphatase family protein [Desulfofarcimen acetoxidans]ACV64154.1 Phosphoglycerate mutase [Desulfofarcimen acetoxidans DSM 771]